MTSRRRVIGTTALASAIIIGPGTAVSCLNAGAQFGLGLLWAVALSGVAAASMGYIVGRVTIATGQTTFGLLDDHIRPGTGALVAYIEVAAHVFAIIAGAYTLADALSALIGRPHWVGLAFLLPVTLLLWVWVGGYQHLRRVLAVGVLAMVGVFAAVLLFSDAPAGTVEGPAAAWWGSQAGLLALMGIIGGAGGDAMLVFLPYQVKAGGLRHPDVRRLGADAIVFLGVAFATVSLCILLVGGLISDGAPIWDTLKAAQLVGGLWGPTARGVFLVGLASLAWTTTAGASFCPGLLLSDVRRWRDGDGGLLIESDPHRDRRFRIVTTLMVLAWLVALPLARVVRPYYVLMLSLGVINLLVPPMLLVVLLVGRSRRVMGDLRLGPALLALGGVALLFTSVGFLGTVRFLIGLVK